MQEKLLFRCLYTNQKQKKKKKWDDGVVFCYPQTYKITLMKWSESFGVHDELLDTMFLSPRKFSIYMNLFETEIETEKFLISLEAQISESQAEPCPFALLEQASQLSAAVEKDSESPSADNRKRFQGLKNVQLQLPMKKFKPPKQIAETKDGKQLSVEAGYITESMFWEQQQARVHAQFRAPVMDVQRRALQPIEKCEENLRPREPPRYKRPSSLMIEGSQRASDSAWANTFHAQTNLHTRGNAQEEIYPQKMPRKVQDRFSFEENLKRDNWNTYSQPTTSAVDFADQKEIRSPSSTVGQMRDTGKPSILASLTALLNSGRSANVPNEPRHIVSAQSIDNKSGSSNISYTKANHGNPLLVSSLKSCEKLNIDAEKVFFEDPVAWLPQLDQVIKKDGIAEKLSQRHTRYSCASKTDGSDHEDSDDFNLDPLAGLKMSSKPESLDWTLF